MYAGQTCWQNAWFRSTTCSCTDNSLQTCSCKRVFSHLAVFFFFVLPLLCVIIMYSGKTCVTNKSCPLYSLEKRYKVWARHEREKEDAALAKLEEEFGPDDDANADADAAQAGGGSLDDYMAQPGEEPKTAPKKKKRKKKKKKKKRKPSVVHFED